MQCELKHALPAEWNGFLYRVPDSASRPIEEGKWKIESDLQIGCDLPHQIRRLRLEPVLLFTRRQAQERPKAMATARVEGALQTSADSEQRAPASDSARPSGIGRSLQKRADSLTAELPHDAATAAYRSTGCWTAAWRASLKEGTLEHNL